MLACRTAALPQICSASIRMHIPLAFLKTAMQACKHVRDVWEDHDDQVDTDRVTLTLVACLLGGR